jgi:hypothetical protein
MKKFVLAVVMAMASISVAQAVEIASITSYSIDSNTLSPGLGIGTKVGPVGVGYVFQESQNNGRITHVHVFGLSKDLWQQDRLALGIKGGAAYLVRQEKSDGWTNMIGPYVSYRLSDDFRIVTDLLFTRGTGDLAETSSTLVQVGFRYKFK